MYRDLLAGIMVPVNIKVSSIAHCQGYEWTVYVRNMTENGARKQNIIQNGELQVFGVEEMCC